MNRRAELWNLAIGLSAGILLAGLVVFLIATLRIPGRIALASAPTPVPIFIDLRGEVVRPGQYFLPPGSRVKDALLLAGGLTPNAKPASLNLARPLVDGETITVPHRDSPDSQTSNPLVNINRASIEELEKLPHIGPVLAKEIAAYRERNGPFQQLEDLMDVPGIGEVTFNEIKLWVILVDP